MSTHSNISVYISEEKIWKTIYCNFDGYTSNNGVLLRDNWTSYEDSKKLVENGDISSLGKDLESTDFYKNREGESWESIKPNISKDILKQPHFYYCYWGVFNGKEMIWYANIIDDEKYLSHTLRDSKGQLTKNKLIKEILNELVF